MSFHWLDLLVLLAFVVTTLVIGLWAAKRASRSIRSYFLAENELPWYMLGISNASGMFDVSGTMWLVYLLFIYGLKSLWIPWLWPVFNQVFLMVYLSTWLRRSGVVTGAEWIRFRFGAGPGAERAHVIVVVFALVTVIGFLAYAFLGIGKFAAIFLPWRWSEDPQTNARLWGLVITGVTALYVVRGGLFGVVFTEVLHYLLLSAASIGVGIIAMRRVSPEMLDRVVPEGWRSPFFGWTLDLDWSELLPAADARIEADGWSLFSVFFLMMVFKGVLQSAAGPAPNYDMQRVLSTRSPREAAKMSGLVSLVLMVPRYMLTTGLTVLALVFFMPQLRTLGDAADFELVLPFAMQRFLPPGLLGLLIAALLAAFMSTYSATVNAAPAYIVNDIYKRYVNPGAEERVYVRVGRIASVVIVAIGTMVGFAVESLNAIVQWIVTGLLGGYTAPNVLKWYWWRLNAHGYFWGMVGGIAAGLLAPFFFEGVTPLYTFPAILAVSLVGCVVGSLATPPDDPRVLEEFYLKVRPWGFWGPVHDRLARRYPGLERNRNFKRDMFNVVVGTAWQTALMATGIYVVLRDFVALSVAVGIVVVASIILKFHWYDRLEDYPADLQAVEAGSRAVPVEAGATGSR